MTIKRFLVLLLLFCLFTPVFGFAADKVVVIPLNINKGTATVCLGTLSSGGRWCDQEDGTVLDMTTRLVWLKKADWGGLRPWRNGSADCNGPSYTCYFDAHSQASTLLAGSPNAGLSDGSVLGEWRMPTAVEMLTLIAAPESVSNVEMRAFTGISDDWYWTSTSSLGSQSDAYVIEFDTGAQGSRYKYLDARVWPVRAAN